ncbi:Antitoxin YefM [Thiorhodovibrio winogradskyi]|uniref:Antitoxin n=1 Tax=Thiorhodovibrio winogradskyi TaxID=77007 RepID=A0ABZ0SEB2_9GAMM|nr:type II toxin-antitoxin system Phd/YefM family antitoxin [Thiorhodovibrio winogradskyi]
MVTITASNARKELYRLMDKTAENHEPVFITGKRTNVVMLSEEDWRSIEETMFLNSVPGLAEELERRQHDDDSEFFDESGIGW